MNVLFVCTGNVCRSPMAEGFLNRLASDRGLDVVARSTGTHAWDGRAATWDGRRIMSELGVPIDDHRTARTTSEHVEWADLIVGMSTEHVRETIRDFPQAEGRTFLIKVLNAAMPKLPEYDGDPDTWTAGVASALADITPPDDIDVEDPFGEREAAYRRVATEIQDLIDTFADGLHAKNIRA